MWKDGISMAVPMIDGNMDDDHMNSDDSESVGNNGSLSINEID